MPSSAMQLVFILLTIAYQTPPDRPFPAHRVIGNVYYVGSHNLASYLFVTPEGHVLINSGFEETVPLIRKSVESLGFQMDDIKILLASHAHSDHVAGLHLNLCSAGPPDPENPNEGLTADEIALMVSEMPCGTGSPNGYGSVRATTAVSAGIACPALNAVRPSG